MKTIKSKFLTVIKLLITWDGLWSIPAAFVVYLLVALYGQIRFGEAWASYQPSIIHAAATSALILVIFNFITLLGLYFNFRGIFTFLTTESFIQTFENLTPWQKVLFSFLYFFSLLLLLILIFCALV